jgi:hypothetical protein
MCCKPATKLTAKTLLTAIFVLGCVQPIKAEAPGGDAKGPITTFEIPGGFSDTNVLKSYFAGKRIPVDVRALHDSTNQYIAVLVMPYSGVDTTQVYCYAQRGGMWLFLAAINVWSGGARSLDIKVEDNALVILRRGRVVFKASPPDQP